MSNTNDIDLEKLTLNSTFYDWYLRTNQIIDYINPINVYDVFAGDGLQESRTGTPGTIQINLGTNPTQYAIDTITNTDGNSVTILNIAGLTSASVANTSTFVFGGTTSKSVLRKVAASDMLPPTINGNHTFTGTITVGDLIVNDGTIVLNAAGSTRDNVGLIIESTADTNLNNISFLYDTDTQAWYSSANLGLASGKRFVTDAVGTAKYPFFASSSQAIVDLQLTGKVGGIDEMWSIKGSWGSPDSLVFGHYTNNSLVYDILELQSLGTNGSRVIVKDALTITDVLNSSPFSAIPATTSVPVTDATNGFLNGFVNRIVVSSSGVVVGDIVRLDSTNAIKAQADSEANSQTIGIVESINGGNATVVTGGICVQRPRNTSGNQFNLTKGQVYYLDQGVSGAVTGTKPSSGIVKPVLIGLSSTECLYVPDFSYSNLIQNAFTSVLVVDTNETINASGSDQLRLKGGTDIALDFTTNNEVVINSTVVGLPSASNYSYYIKQTSAEGLVANNYSILGRPLNGNIANIDVAAGTLVGRRADTDDSNNPVEALLPSQVRSMLGFSGNRYIKSVLFEDIGSTDVQLFDAINSETVTVRAGFGIDFSYDSVDNAIIINNTGGGGGGGGGTGSVINVSDQTTNATDISQITFANNDIRGFINFTVAENTSGIATIYASPKNSYLRLTSSNTSVFHDPGDGLRIVGSGGINVSLASVGAFNTFTVSLGTSIVANTITSNTDILTLNTSTSRVSFQIGDDSGDTGSGYNATDLGYTTKIQTYDNITQSVTRIDSTAYNGYTGNSTTAQSKCVSLFADVNISGDIVSFPFRFFKIIADSIEVTDLNVTGTAIKNFAEINSISGELAVLGAFNFGSIKFQDGGAGSDGVLFNFESSNPSQNNAFIIKPSVGTTFGGGIATSKSLFISEKIFFTNNTATSFTPSIGLDTATSGSVLVESISAQSQFRLKQVNNNTIAIGVQNGYGYLSYDSDNTGNPDASMTISDNSSFNGIAKFGLYSGINGDTGGIEYLPITYNTGDIGKGLRITSVSSGIATVEAKDYIKPYSDPPDINDPINTLYYTV
jgi:hypothetical protein